MTSTDLRNSGSGKYIPPELKSIQSTEWVPLVNPSIEKLDLHGEKSVKSKEKSSHEISRYFVSGGGQWRLGYIMSVARPTVIGMLNQANKTLSTSASTTS